MKKHEDTYGKLASVEARRPKKTTRIILARLQKNAGRRKRGQQSIELTHEKGQGYNIALDDLSARFGKVEK